MKRALLIASGTVGGLGAVLAITPPQLSSTTSASSLLGSLGGPSTGGTVTTAAVTHAASPAATKNAATKATSKASAKATTGASASASASATQTQAVTPTPTATKTTAAPATSGYSGTVTGASFAARNYGTLSATVTFSNGQISHVSASQSPSSWSQNVLPTLTPYVSSGKITVEQIKSYAAEQLPCAISNSCRSQASFTATAFWSSVKSAITKAGL
ncbi:hypothetical protein MCETOYE15_00061 [Candidatus Nanopelagicaceae bacterium]